MKLKQRPSLLPTEYGTYRDDVVQWLASELPREPIVLFDPMCGTAPLLPLAETRGYTAHFNDLSPLHWHVNAARTWPARVAFAEIGSTSLLALALRHCGELRDRRPTISEKWIDDRTFDGLKAAWERFEAERESVRALLRCILLLSVRGLSCYTPSGNPTSPKPGGMSGTEPLDALLQRAIVRLEEYHAFAYPSGVTPVGGKVAFTTEDGSTVRIGKKADVVATSPPFPNRVDWQRLYAPEHHFLAQVGHAPSPSAFMGTPRVHDYRSLAEEREAVSAASPHVGELIDSAQASQRGHERTSDYYVKYFTRYFALLFGVLENAVAQMKARGRLFVMVQNNVHRKMEVRMDLALREFLEGRQLEVHVPFEELRPHMGLRNISRKMPLVLPRQREHILVAHR